MSKTSGKRTDSSSTKQALREHRLGQQPLTERGPRGKEAAALEAAQEIIWDAWELNGRQQRIALAKKALEVSHLCADAYVMLAFEAAKTPKEAMELYRHGVEAGEKALGRAAFRDDVGAFWGILETRPYMRALHGLAQTIWDAGDRDETVTYYRELLRLNPNDNQGIRYLLLDCLLVLGRDSEAADLLKQYEDDGAGAWAWSEALLAFRVDGDNLASRQALAQAVEANPHIPAYLLGRKKMPRQLPEYISWGDASEAVAYVHGAMEAWAAAPGALAWLAAAEPSLDTSETDDDGPGMEAELQLDTDAIDDAVLALLYLGLHDHVRAWKTFDWEAMNRLHAKGLMSNPVGKAKSVALTAEGVERSRQLLQRMFVKQ
jgi:tetratricopeptide (TPR) repeat protein